MCVIAFPWWKIDRDLKKIIVDLPSLPDRKGQMGTAATENQLRIIKRLGSQVWSIHNIVLFCSISNLFYAHFVLVFCFFLNSQFWHTLHYILICLSLHLQERHQIKNSRMRFSHLRNVSHFLFQNCIEIVAFMICFLKYFSFQNWDEILPMTDLRPGYKTSCHNFFNIKYNKRVTHLRLNMFPGTYKYITHNILLNLHFITCTEVF